VGLADKLERLVSLVVELLAKLAQDEGLAFEFPPRRAMAALSLGFDQSDVVDFIAFSIENTFSLRIDPAALAPGLGFLPGGGGEGAEICVNPYPLGCPQASEHCT